MRLRSGFVSNSSASSFIVFFPHEPKDLSDLHDMLFPEGDRIFSPVLLYDWGETDAEPPRAVTTMDIASLMWEDILSARLGSFFSVQDRLWEHFKGYNTRETFDEIAWEAKLNGEEEERFTKVFDAVQATDFEDADDELREEFLALLVRLRDAAIRVDGELPGQLSLFPPDVEHAYAFCYGTGSSAVENVMANDTEYLDRVPFVLTMDP